MAKTRGWTDESWSLAKTKQKVFATCGGAGPTAYAEGKKFCFFLTKKVLCYTKRF
jgi:hypothetical protein